MMKFIILLLIGFTFGANASGIAQTVTLHVKNEKLENVLDEVSKQTKIRFFYDEKLIQQCEPISVSMNNASIQQVMESVIKDHKLSYEMVNGTIVITGVRQSELTIRGVVRDLEGVLADVSISVEGHANITTRTAEDGTFSLRVPMGAVLLFRHVGYSSERVVVNESKSFDILLKPELSQLDEVVVVGYGKQKKVNLTGAVDVVDGKKLQNRPTSNVAQAIAGTVPGLKISYGNAGFEPGATPSVQIRGQGTPYVLIDGVVGDLSSIDPNSIESISVLKDAAASAIYGARAPYGVLLVTTKSGKFNQKPQVDFSMNGGPTTIINKPKMVDSYSFVRAMNEMHDNQGVSRLFTEQTIDRIIARISDPSLPETVPDGLNPTKWSTYTNSNGDNDWVDVHFGNGFRSQENLSVRGGGNDASYFLSFGHAYEKGLFKMVTDNYNRYNVNAKVDVNVTDWWKLSSNTRMISGERNKPIYNGEGDYGMLIHQIFRTQPEVYLKSPNGHYSQLSRVPQMQAGYQKFVDNNLVQRLATELKLTKKWILNADYSVNYKVTNNEGLNTVAFEDEVDGNLVPISLTVPSYITKDKDNNNYKSLNVFSSYQFDLKDSHHFNMLVGYQQESNKYDWLSGVKRELISAEVPSITTSTGEMLVYDDISHWSTQGYFGRLTYNFNDKYLFESNLRYDGTSKFASGNRWGFFPSFSAGWNVSKEPFWESLHHAISNVKVRGSWGKLGNQNVVAYQDLALLSVQNNLSWMINGKRPPYTTAPNLVNKFLSWESSQTTNIGLEFSVLDNRLQAVFDYYQRLTFDRLGPAKALPGVIGAVIPQENNSELKTKGWDLSLVWSDRTDGDFNYSIMANLSDYTNVVTKYPNPTGTLTTDYIGKTEGEIWGYETVGLIQTTERANQINSSNYQRFINGQPWQAGDIEYGDLNHDGKIDNGKNTISDHGDIRVIGNSTPRYIFGLNLSASYKNFDVSVFIQGTAKRDLWLTGNIFWGFNQWNQTSLFPHHLDYYRDQDETIYSGLGVNTDAYFPRPYSNSAQDNKNKQIQTRYLQNGAFARLQNLQIGYKLPQVILTKTRLKSGRIYFSGENVYTLTKLTAGFDPETANLGQYGNGKGMFSQAVWAMGLNLSF